MLFLFEFRVDLVEKLSQFVMEKFDALKSNNSIDIKVHRMGDSWVGDYKNQFYRKASMAIENVWGMKPLLIREGGN